MSKQKRVSASSMSKPPAGFPTTMAQFYRGEVGRSNMWRSRLDTTTNWAVLTTGATLTFAFSNPDHPHFVIPLNSLLVAFFLYMEARRYRYYEIWSSHGRIIEMDYFASLLNPAQASKMEWQSQLMEELSTPQFTISIWEAIGRRLRRNYLLIFILLAICWCLKIYLQPQPAGDLSEFVTRTSVGLVPGWLMLVLVMIFNSAVVIIALATIGLHEAKGTRVR